MEGVFAFFAESVFLGSWVSGFFIIATKAWMQHPVGPTASVRDSMFTNLTDHPWRLVFPLLAIAAVVGMWVYQRRGDWAAGVRRLLPIHRGDAHDDGRGPVPQRVAGARG
jgi:cytochrome bd-type quinol oxidase subunit 1